MKNKSFFKSYGLIIIAIIGCLVGLVFLGLNIFTSKDVKMKDLTNLDKTEVLNWVNKNDLENFINYSYEYSLDVEEGKVISQSLNEKESIDKPFTVVISKGSIADVNNTLYADKTSFDEFIKTYNNVKVIYEEIEDNLEKGKIVKFSKSSINLKNDEVTVSISLGKTEEKNEEPKEEDNKDDGDKVIIPGDMLGIDEAKFIKTLNDLGFKNLKKDSQKYYSFKSKKDTIFSYDDGKFETSKTINYALSLGDYPTAFNKADYENKTLNDAKKVVENYNKLNAHITLKTNNVTTSDTSKVGLLTGCAAKKDGSNSIVTCSLLTKEEKSGTIPNTYLGKSEIEFINAIKALGFTNYSKSTSLYSSYAKDTICKYDSGTYKLSDTIHYTMSLGQYICNVNDFNGKTVSAANNFISPLNSIGANIKFSYSDVPNDSITKDTLYDCDANGSQITCKLAKNKEKYNLLNKSMLSQTYSKSTYEATEKAIIDAYKNCFPNLIINKVSSELAVGQIVDVRVNGSSSYATGDYDYDIKLEVDICSEQSQ